MRIVAVAECKLCERAADECARLEQFLLKGLPIAKPPR